MELAALCSGGKDSTYALWLASEEGHEIKKLVAMFPQKENSWMFHKPNREIIKLFSKTSQIPLVEGETLGEKEKELDDLKMILRDLSVKGIVNGAVASTYQKNRIEKICKELDYVSLTPLWEKEPSILLENMIKEGFEIIITSVSAEGLTEEWLGRRIDQNCINDLKKLHREIGIHITGEGGEYETLVLDAPFFKRRIVPQDFEMIWKGDRGSLKIKKAKLVKK